MTHVRFQINDNNTLHVMHSLSISLPSIPQATISRSILHVYMHSAHTQLQIKQLYAKQCVNIMSLYSALIGCNPAIPTIFIITHPITKAFTHIIFTFDCFGATNKNSNIETVCEREKERFLLQVCEND